MANSTIPVSQAEAPDGIAPFDAAMPAPTPDGWTGRVALSVGCMLSRVRTGMSNNEVTCAIPVGKVGELLDRLKTANGADMKVAAYAAADAKRFA